MLTILIKFLSGRSQHVMVDGCRSKLVNAVSGVSQGGVFGLVIVLPNTVLENRLIGYADEYYST